MKKTTLDEHLTAWLDETAQTLVNETVKIINHHKKPKSDFNLTEVLYYVYVEKFIQAIVEGALTAHETIPNINNHQRYTLTTEKLAIVKANLQNEIARGFEQAFKRITGVDEVEYLCNITVVPEPKNKLPC